MAPYLCAVYKSFESVSFKNGEQYYNKLHFIFNAIVAIPLFPFALIYLDIQKFGTDFDLVDDKLKFVLQFLLPIGSIVLSVLGFRIYKRIMSTIDPEVSLRAKLVCYFNASIWKYTYLEMALLIDVLGLFLTRSSVFVVIFVFILIAISLGRPTIKSIIKVLQLSTKEATILHEKLEIA